MPYPRLLSLILVGAVLAAGAVPARAQFGTLRGRVVSAAEGRPLPDVNLVLDDGAGSRAGTATDAEGRFVLPSLPPGRYVLQASYVGFAPWADTLLFDFGETKSVEIRLEAAAAALDDVVVEERRGTEGTRTIPVGLTTVRPSDLARVPLPGGSPDLAAYLLTRPGVVTAGDRGGQLFIRGGTPTENLVLIDGTPLYQPFHIVGFYSAFPADLVSYADVYAGGFGARYGGRLSSVIDVQTRNGNKRRVVGALSAAPFLSALRLEVPVVHEQASVIVSVRESMIERLAPRLLGRSLPYRFGDRFAKFHAFLNQTSSLALTALGTYDEGDVADRADSALRTAWRNAAYGGRYVYLPPDFPALFQVHVFASSLDSRHQVFEGQERTARVEGIGGEASFLYFLGISEVQAGLFARTTRFRYRIGPEGALEEAVTEGGVYADTRIELTPRVRVEPGLRLHSFPSRNQIAFEPRLRAAWQSGRHTFSAAWGRYHQQIVGLYNLRDVTDAFVVWAPSPPNAPVPTAVHTIGGWQGQLAPGLDVSAEVYRKRMSNLVTARYTERPGAALTLAPADGRARGLDVKAELTRPTFYLYAGYGLADVQYQRLPSPGGLPAEPVDARAALPRRFRPPHDRRHQLDLLARLARGPAALSLRWQFGSGLPFTQAQGFYDALPLPSPTGDPAYRTRPGETVVLPAAPYAARLPAYHRLDVALAWRFTFSHLAATVQASVVNAYDRPNLFDYDVLTGRRVDQLPLIPSLALNLETRAPR